MATGSFSAGLNHHMTIDKASIDFVHGVCFRSSQIHLHQFQARAILAIIFSAMPISSCESIEGTLRIFER
jgi:hypothetical protein